MSTPGITSTCAQAYEANPMSAIIADATDEQTGFGGDEREHPPTPAPNPGSRCSRGRRTPHRHKVVAFISGNHLDPDIAADLFIIDTPL
jgi:hypothetical protein